MTDYIQLILNGLFTGIGVYGANYLGKNHIENKLKKLNEKIKKIIKRKKKWKPIK